MWNEGQHSQSCRPRSFFLMVTCDASSSSASPKDSSTVFLAVSVARQHMMTHFFALARFALFSDSCLASKRACCCARFSAAVIRGTMSSKGFSMIRTPVIFGGLRFGELEDYR